MNTLNLVYPDKSDIKYKISRFPDGQQNIVLLNSKEYIDDVNILYKPIHIGYNLTEFKSFPVQIKSRLNNWLDLELITCAVASLRELEVEEIHLYVPYIMGARSDRKFEEGGNNYLKNAICPIINSLGFKTVTCIDPHSDCLEMGIKGFRKESNEKLVRFFYQSLEMQQRNGCSVYSAESACNNTILVSPDAGATKKIYKLAEKIGYEGDIITCSKDRDENGKLTKTIVPLELGKYINKDFIIIDDICDGGATFINIAKEIKNQISRITNLNNPILGKIYLIVTHGIFSKGPDELSKYFENIYCTNSYSDLIPEVWGIVENKPFINQLNIF